MLQEHELFFFIEYNYFLHSSGASFRSYDAGTEESKLANQIRFNYTLHLLKLLHIDASTT